MLCAWKRPATKRERKLGWLPGMLWKASRRSRIFFLLSLIIISLGETLFEMIEGITFLRHIRWGLEEGQQSVTWMKGATGTTSIYGYSYAVCVRQGRTISISEWLGTGSHNSTVRIAFFLGVWYDVMNVNRLSDCSRWKLKKID